MGEDRIVFDLEALIEDANYPLTLGDLESEDLRDVVMHLAEGCPFTGSRILISMSVYYWFLNHDLDKFSVLYTQAIDSQTSTLQKRYFENRFLPKAISRADVNKAPLCYGILDIDDFKNVNTLYGLLAGDQVLESISKVIRLNREGSGDAPTYIEIGRIGGGEEFGIIMYGISIIDAIKIMERIRSTVEETLVDVGGSTINVKISGGVSEYLPGMGLHELRAQASEYCENAKQRGKNMIVSRFNYRPAPGYTSIDDSVF